MMDKNWFLVKFWIATLFVTVIFIILIIIHNIISYLK